MTAPVQQPIGGPVCVGCHSGLDLSKKFHKIEAAVGRITFIFCFCSSCAADNSSRGIALRDKQASAAVAFLRHNPDAHCPYAILSSLSLWEHDGDPVKAYEQGTTLPKHVFDSWLNGKAEFTKIGGVIVAESQRDQA